MIWIVPALFGIGCAVTYWRAVRSGDPNVRSAALALALIWALANLAWYTNNLWFLSVMDWLFGVLLIIYWWECKEKWVASLIHLVALRLILHVMDYITAQQYLVTYIHILNAVFALQLLIVATSGGRHGRGFDNLLGWLRGLRRSVSASAVFRRNRR